MIRSARDLSADQKLAIESLIGHELSEQDEISIRRIAATSRLTPERRREIVDGLRKHFAEVDAQRKSMSNDEAEEILNEALRSVKSDYHSIL